MDEVEMYDVILLGTGFKECLLAALFCQANKKVLILDREQFVGGDNGSIADLEDLQKKFNDQLPQNPGEWNVDLVPKLFLTNEKMMTLLRTLGVSVNFKPIHNAFLYEKDEWIKVPNSALQINMSSTLTEKDKELFKDFLKTKNQSNIEKIVKKYQNTQSLLESKGFSLQGRKILLHGMGQNFTNKSVEEFLSVLHCFCNPSNHQPTSLHYPIYGLGEIINSLLKYIRKKSGKCMTNRPIYSVKNSGGMIEVDARGLRGMSRFLVGDPSYFKLTEDDSRKVVRALCVLDDEFNIPNACGKTKSCLIIIPGNYLNKTHDAYILVLGSEHYTSPDGLYIAHASTIVESDDPEAEIKKIIGILGTVKVFSTSISSIFKNSSDRNNIFITSTYDFSMSWNSACEEILNIYENITDMKLIF